MSALNDLTSLISVLESPNLQAGREVKELILDILHNNKDAWLVNDLINLYAVTQSQRCLEIIMELREPHDKHVFDCLNEYIRGPHKLAVISILAGLVYKQVSWLHKIVVHPLMNSLLKCLKTEDSDIPVLLSGLLVVTALLPVVPVTIKDHLPHLFEVFSNLASLCLKTPAQVPELYRYHLEVGIYCLHQRLYGMYPYHFLTYLRNIYSKQEQQQVFETVIKPMVEKVRLHPLLFTTTREKEVSRERWRHKEVHDILVECAQYSLDLTEGSTTEMSTPGPQRITEHFKAVPRVLHAVSDLMTPGAGSLVGKVDPASVMTSVLHTSAMTSGLHMPEINLTQGGQGLEQQPPTPQASHVGITGQQSTTPEISGQGEKTPKLKKRISQSGLTLASKIASSTETTPVYPDQHTSIPPSPLRPDFVSDPPLVLQHKQPIRKLTFTQSEAISQGETLMEKVMSSLEEMPHQITTSKSTSDAQHMIPPGDEPSSASVGHTPVPADTKEHGQPFTESVKSDNTQHSEPKHATPQRKMPMSLSNLPKVLDALDKNPEDVDSEVSELTADHSAMSEMHSTQQESADSPAQLPTTTSMAALMKKVNRIRFNSINVNMELPEMVVRVTRARSCPTVLTEQSMTRDRGGLRRHDKLASFSIESPPLSMPADEKKSEKLVKCSSSQTSLYALSSALLRGQSAEPVTMDTTATETEDPDLESPMNKFPYQELFSLMLPFSPFIQCYYCLQHQVMGKGDQNKAKVQPALDDIKPVFASYSAVELLDHLIDTGSKTHQRLASTLGTATHRAIPANLSNCDDISVLRGQIAMLHHQLLYERHKRELHAQRNRRLLSRTVKTAALEEQNNAMQDQLILQEKELVQLREALKKQQHLTQQLQHTTATHEAEIEKLQKTYRLKLEALENKVKDLEAQLEKARSERDKSIKELQSYQARVYVLDKEVEILKTKTETTSELEEQVKQLNKELLLMGELQQKYQSRLVAHTRTESDNIHTKFLLETYKTELNSLKKKLSRKTVLLESCENKLTGLEEVIKNKDQALLEHKQLLETARDYSRQEIEALQDKYDSLKRVHSTLQTEFLNVYDKIGRLEATIKSSHKQKEPRAGLAILRDGQSQASHQAKCTGKQQMSGTPEAWKAPTSESSVDSAEEAYSVDTSSQ